MNYHTIRTDDMLNGDGLRVVLFISGCNNHCDGCHNPETWDINSGKPFTEKELNLILDELSKEYISGLTISGGEPLLYDNLPEVYDIIKAVKDKYPNTTVWLYTGYNLKPSDFVDRDTGFDNAALRNMIIRMCDVICDGKFIKELADANTPWVGSTNQRVINVKEFMERYD